MRESQQLFQSFVDRLPVAAYLKDKEGRYVYVNRKVEALIGEEYGFLRGKRDSDIFSPELADRVRKDDQEALRSGQITRIAEKLPSSTGVQHLLTFKFPLANSSGEQFIAGVSLDITDQVNLQDERDAILDRELVARKEAETALTVLRETETRLRCLFDSSVIGIIEINHERILDASKSFLDMLGYSRQDLTQGDLKWRSLTPGKYEAVDAVAIDRLVREGSFPPYEKEMIRKDGSPVSIWIGGAQLNPAPDWTSVAFVLDLSERKHLERQFLGAQKLKTLGLLSSAITHDFNNLLTTIMGNASLALDSVTPEHPSYSRLEEVLRGSRVASNLTQQLLAYSGKKVSGPKAVEVSALVREISGLMELPMSRKIELSLKLENGLPPIHADQTQIQQVVMNLVVNAADAIGDQPGVINVTTGCRLFRASELRRMRVGGELPGGNYVYFQVSDTGCGMSAETQDRMFDPLFTTKTRGWGLGLAAVQGIVRSHHGALDVESVVDHGTIFTVLFPVGTPEIAPAPAPSPEQKLWGNETVLVVDDEPSVRKMAEVTLERYGYKVLTASNGKEAVEVYTKRAADISLVILDLAMPVMSGEEAAVQLHALRPDLKIVISSGYNESETMERLSRYRVIPKPYTSRQLATQVRQFLSEKET